MGSPGGAASGAVEDALRDATIVLTGATTGIGRATALALAGYAGTLILHGPQPEHQTRDLPRLVRAAAGSHAVVRYFSADYGDLAQVTRLAADIRATTGRIDVLVNNAARPGPPTRTVTRAGNEITLQTNYLAPVLLTADLRDLIGNGAPGRIVNIASATHLSATLHLDDLQLARHPYSPSSAYAHSKLALVTYSCWLAAHRPHPSLEVVSMHPGVISTPLLHAMFAVSGDPPEQAAGAITYVAARRGDNGTYYDQRSPARTHPQAADRATQDRLHALTSRLLRDVLPPPDPPAAGAT